MMRSHRILSVFGLVALALLGLPWDQAHASEGTTAAGYAFIAGLVVLGAGALVALSLGISLRRYHRSRLGRGPRRGDVSRWEWFFMTCVPRPTPDAHHSGGVFDLHAGKPGSSGGGDAGGSGGEGV